MLQGGENNCRRKIHGSSHHIIQRNMRKVVIRVRNNQEIEIFVDRLREGFEFWAVGMVKGRRILIDHHLTHDDLEARLEYAQPGDLIWHDAARSEIPFEKHGNAIAQEETMSRRVFWDYDGRAEGQIQSVTCHLGAIGFLTPDRKESSVAKKMMLGAWTDGILSFRLEPQNKLVWSCAKTNYWLSRRDGHKPDWWNFARWGIGLINQKHSCGTHVGVLHVGEHELHLKGGGHLHRMAHIFRRI